MNTLNRKVVIATAATLLMSGLAWSDTHNMDAITDGEPPMETQSETDNWSSDPGSDPGIDQMRVQNNPLLGLTPNELKDMDVMGSDGERVGKIKDIVGSMTSNDSYAVVTQGGLMGIGAHVFVISLDELTHVNDDQVSSEMNEATAESSPEYDSDNYAKMDADRPVFEYSYLNR